MDVYNRFNPNERLVAIGAAVILVAWLVGLVSGFGFGVGTIPFLGAIAVLVILYVKYSPNQHVNWPAPVELIILGISVVVALLAVLAALQWLGFLASFFGLAALAALATAVGAVIMAWGAWKEYQAMPKTTPPSSNNPPTA